jgi:GntR family transcriptional regulator
VKEQTAPPLTDLFGDAPRPHRGRGPLYAQVAEDVARRVSTHGLQAGHRLPSESDLATAYQVNRLTVRRALAELSRAGLLKAEHGVGTFVAAPVVRHRVDDGRLSLMESLRLRGLRVRHVLLDQVRLQIPQARFTDFPGPLVQVRFVRWVEDEPWSLSTVTVPESLLPRSEWEESRSLFAAMESDHGLRLRRCERIFAAVPAETEDSRHLIIPLGSPLLLVSGTNVDQQGRLVAEVVHRTRGDRAEYAVALPEHQLPDSG